MKVAEIAFYLEPVPANCIAMSAAGNEQHIVSSCGHPPAEITSHGTRRHDRHPHVTPSANKTFVWGWTPDTFLLRMRPPGRLGHQLHLLAHHQRSELRSEPLDEILVREHGRPVRTPVAIVLEFPDVHELIDHPRVGDEIPNEVLVVATRLQRRKPELGIELLRLSHFADIERIGTHFVERHPILLFLPLARPTTSDTGSPWLEHEDAPVRKAGTNGGAIGACCAIAGMFPPLERALLQPEPSPLHIGAEILALWYGKMKLRRLS